MCQLPKATGCVQTGYRPVYIASNDTNNTYSRIVNVIPISSQTHKRLPVHVDLRDYKQYGLSVPSILMFEQMTTVPMDCLDRRIGEIADELTIKDMQRAAAIQFPFILVS